MAVTAEMYQRGMNELLDAMLEDDEVVWIVQGPKGRVPMSAGSKEEAIKKYKAYTRPVGS